MTHRARGADRAVRAKGPDLACARRWAWSMLRASSDPMARPNLAAPLAPPALAALAVGFVLALAASAQAQTVTVTESGISRDTGFRSQAQNPLWISLADCTADDVLHFPLQVANYSGYSLEVWAGGASADCRTTESRNGTAAACWQAYAGTPTSITPTVDIRVRDVIGQHHPYDSTHGPGAGTLADCSSTSVQSAGAPQAVTLYFMFVQSGGALAGSGYAWNTKFDLVGPTAPSGVSAGIGEQLLVLDWTQSVDTDLLGYNFYCDPTPGNEAAAAHGGAFDASIVDAATADAIECDDGSASVTDAGADDAADADLDAGDAGTKLPLCSSLDAGSDAAVYTGSCPTSTLVPGQLPPATHYCGGVTSPTATSGRIEGLQNFYLYSVAIAGVDSVGNVGPISDIACEEPQPVDDFFKLYRRAGGQAGGGFCATSHVGQGAASGFALVAAVGVATLLVRRRRRRGAP